MELPSNTSRTNPGFEPPPNTVLLIIGDIYDPILLHGSLTSKYHVDYSNLLPQVSDIPQYLTKHLITRLKHPWYSASLIHGRLPLGTRDRCYYGRIYEASCYPKYHYYNYVINIIYYKSSIKHKYNLV